MKWKLREPAAYLLCAILIWRFTSPLEETEFSGGQITARLLNMAEIGILLFITAAILVFLSSRISAGTAAIACLTSLPMYAYFAFPKAFQQLFPGEYSVPGSAYSAWGRSYIGIVTLLLALLFSIRTLLNLNASKPNPLPRL
ncbi:MAG TPA: hypothetical protein VGS78_00850 [Candidatus Sulfotelmatobacter sp.]|nr:hypothetical protein [Candidatus Sulfotelmatobacter sp.]